VSVAALAAGATAFLAVLATAELARTFPPARAVGSRLPRTFRPEVATSLLHRFRPALSSLGAVRRLAPPEDLRRRLTAAGEPGGLGVREWLAIKLASATVVSLPAILIAGGGPGRLGLLLALAAPLAGFVLPDYWLARLARARIEDARRRLPDVLDLLRVTVEAGVPPMRALHNVSACFEGVLAAECRRVATSAALGEPQDAALARRARRHGLPLGKTLAMQASRARQARSQEIRERAARAGPKIQLAVALLLVPAMLLMVAAVLASELLSPGLGLSY
jgi:tight adherence protein C